MSTLVLLLVALGITVALFAATAHKALVEIAWHDLEEYCRLNHRDSVFDDIHDRCETTIASTEALQTLGVVMSILLVVSAPLNQRAEVSWLFNGTMLAWTLLIVCSVLAVTVWLPREVARCWGSAYLTHTWPVWRTLDRILWPLHAVTSVIRLVTRRLDGQTNESTEEEALEDEILSIVTEGQHDGLLEDDVREMIAGVIELDDSDVADIMTPRSKMDAIPLQMPWAEVLKYVVRVGRTRIPVFDKNLDDVVGLLYVKDLLAFLSNHDAQNEPSLASVIREVRSVPEKTRLDELLQNFLHTRSHLAMVVDEFMHVVGLVTIEDVLEEIVGEIVDETDAEEPIDIRWIDDQSAEVMGRAHVVEINEAMGIQLPVSHEYDTIGGFILHQFGRIPSKGESLKWENLEIRIDQATKRRIERLVVSL